jgi:hypothetical protein
VTTPPLNLSDILIASIFTVSRGDMKAVVLNTSLVVFLMVTAGFSQQTPSPESQGPCGAAEMRFNTRTIPGKPASPESGKARVYVEEVFRKVPGELGNPTLRVGLDGTWMGATRANSFIAFNVDPGEHHLCTNWQSHFRGLSREKSFANFIAEANKTYYFRARVSYQSTQTATTMTLDLDPLNPDEGQRLIASSRASASYPQK